MHDLLQWVLEQDVLGNINIAKLAYKSLALFDFKFEDEIDYMKLIEICLRTLVKLTENNMECESSTPDTEFSTYLSFVVKITANLCSANSNAREHFITHGFVRPNVSMVQFFNQLFAIQKDSVSRKELFWLVGTLVKNTSSPGSLKYLEDDDFVNRLKVPVTHFQSG